MSNNNDQYIDTATPETINHYLRPDVMEIIIGLSKIDQSCKAGNGDFWRWYKGNNGNKTLFNLTNKDDYTYLVSHYRTLYYTLNYFNGDAFSRTKINENDIVGTRAETTAYQLGIDLDHCDGTDIHTPEVKKAVEDMAQFYIDTLKKYQPKSVYACYSGGGIYVKLHPQIWKGMFEKINDNDLTVFAITTAFNLWIAEKAQEFFKLHPEHIGKVKADALNNAKRVFKTLLSIHRKLPYAVIPLDTDKIVINFDDAKLPLKAEIIEKAKKWCVAYDEENNFKEELKKYNEEVQQKYNRETLTHSISISPEAIKRIELFPPCIKNIINSTGFNEGKTRAITFLVTFLGQAGWNEPEAQELFFETANTLDAQTSNIFQSWYRKMTCPNCATVKKVGKGFPGLDLGALNICKPDIKCNSIKNPIQYIYNPKTQTDDADELINLLSETCKDCKYFPSDELKPCKHPNTQNDKKRNRMSFDDTICEWFKKDKTIGQKTDNLSGEGNPPEVNSIDDIPLPIEDIISPISFEGLYKHSYHGWFIEYMASVSDTYPEYSLQNAIATLSTLARRRLHFRINGRAEYTNLITLNLGQSGYARKSVGMSASQDLLQNSIGDTFVSKDATPEGLITEIADKITTKKRTKDGYEDCLETPQYGKIRKAICALWKDEAGQFYAQLNKPHMQSFKELMCHLYDCPANYTKSLSSKKIDVDEIYFSMNLATTPTSFINNVTTKDVSTGFLARHNIVNPSYQKDRKDITEDSDENIITQSALQEILKILDKLLPEKSLRVNIGKEELKILNAWCKDREEYFARERNEIMGSFFARFQINVLKIALLLDLGNVPASLYFYKNCVDNSYSENRIIIRQGEIISKNGKSVLQTDNYLNNIVSHLNNSNISDYNISRMCISKSSLIYALKLYDSVFIPYAYQICINSKVALFTNYLSNIYNILQDKKKIDRANLMRLSNVSKRADFDEAMETLKEAGAVIEYRVKGKTKPISAYVYVPAPYTKLKFDASNYTTEVDNGFIELTKKGYVEPDEDKQLKEIKDKTQPQQQPNNTKEEKELDPLQKFFKDTFGHMGKPDNVAEKTHREWVATFNIKREFKFTPEHALKVWNDYCVVREW